MPTRTLPPHPSIVQLRLQARELRRAHRERKPSAAARIAAHHPRMGTFENVLDHPLALTAAQLVVAREYGFPSWARLKHHVETETRIAKCMPHPLFEDAVGAMDAGDIRRLRELIVKHPELIRARGHLQPPYDYFTGATLLHYIAANPDRGIPVPGNIVDMGRLLLDNGADVDAVTLGTHGGTTMGLVLTSRRASEANVSGPLMELLLEYGAELDLDPSVLDLPLSNAAPRAAEKLIDLGVHADVCAAAALGRMEVLRGCFDTGGRLRDLPRRHGRVLSERDAIGLALLFAYVNKHPQAVEFLLARDGNWNMTGVQNGTALHRAAWDGDLAMVKRLVDQGADIGNRQNPFCSTPLSWAAYNGQDRVVRWMRTHCRIDLHEAVCFDLWDHIQDRLREDRASVNRRLDQWHIPQSTPLHWAVWPPSPAESGTRRHDPARREQLVQLLLEQGADPNIVAGNGLTPLDMADAAGAVGIAALLKRHGGAHAEAL